jgi:DNA-binding NtrC family response regulator
VLFLDEIGELDLTLQTKLLRVLQEGAVLGVGEEREVPVDVRVVAATHRDLAALVAAGRFRADLLHRLHVLPLALPPLRERRDDIPVLVRHFLSRQPAGAGGERPTLADDLLEALAELPLPGNVRQLENLLRQMLANKREPGPLQLSDLPAAVLDELADQLGVKVAPDAAAAESRSGTQALTAIMGELAEVNDWKLARCLAACECEVVAAALKRVAGNQTRAAGLLGVTTRCVYNKIRKFGLSAQ